MLLTDASVRACDEVYSSWRHVYYALYGNRQRQTFNGEDSQRTQLWSVFIGRLDIGLESERADDMRVLCGLVIVIVHLSRYKAPYAHATFLLAKGDRSLSSLTPSSDYCSTDRIK